MKFGTRGFKWFILGLFLIFAGIEIAVTLTYFARWIGLVLIVSGIAIMIFLAQRRPAAGEEEAAKPKEEGEKGTLAELLISALTLRGRLTVLLPAIGILLVVLVYAFNLMQYGTLRLGVNDTITILLGLVLIFYNYVPVKFKAERDFVLLFFVFLFLILVVPLTIYGLYSGPVQENVNSPFIYYLLAEPTAGLLNLFGIQSSAHMVSSPRTIEGVNITKSGVYIIYQNLGVDAGQRSSVMIGLSCTGLYSVSIFISGFTAFILMEYRQFDVKVASLLTLGVITSWFANILRMALIVAVGSHFGSEALLWTHNNLGIIIFMIWVGLFWGVMFKLLVGKDPQKGGEAGALEKDNEEEEAVLVNKKDDASQTVEVTEGSTSEPQDT
ncbi:MAG: exosortase/archaeosortase family protein [Thermoplasmata archaeon]|nr:MAG: exosortase/archaeosortase family protein [Thermoplasmata archaeon]